MVHLNRPPDMEEARQQLPIIGLEQEVMEGINMHDVVVGWVAGGLGFRVFKFENLDDLVVVVVA